MIRPTVTHVAFPKTREEMIRPHAPAGVVVETNASWRTERPILENDACVRCLLCYLVCPEGTIYKTGDTLGIDYDFCKGCGICANECPKNAIAMIAEEANR
ncbi:MAG: 4Fe-4S binding protein [Deltaproteobacteria bacterium]|jgi:pyruvate ferredoxin oxidoreductase delta subunit|nr:4Fe-4S binding protein [Deltaproteobacteria bacterium]